MERINTESQLLPNAQQPGQQSSRTQEGEASGNARLQERPAQENGNGSSLPHDALRPSIEIQSMPSQFSLVIASKSLTVPPSAPTPPTVWHSGSHVVPAKPQAERETAIDILYENERGGFLCGKPLFSSAALGTLDPPAWSMSHRTQITGGPPILTCDSECIPQTFADKRLHSRSARPDVGVGLVRVAHQPTRGRGRGRMGVFVCLQR